MGDAQRPSYSAHPRILAPAKQDRQQTNSTNKTNKQSNRQEEEERERERERERESEREKKPQCKLFNSSFNCKSVCLRRNHESNRASGTGLPTSTWNFGAVSTVPGASGS